MPHIAITKETHTMVRKLRGALQSKTPDVNITNGFVVHYAVEFLIDAWGVDKCNLKK